jgi:hypothetical protein
VAVILGGPPHDAVGSGCKIRQLHRQQPRVAGVSLQDCTGHRAAVAIDDAGCAELRGDLLAEPEPGNGGRLEQFGAVGWVRPDQVGVCARRLSKQQHGDRRA